MAAEALEYDLHHGDLPDSFKPAPVVAIDTEAMGLQFRRDRLCLAQFSNGDGTPVQLVAFPPVTMLARQPDPDREDDISRPPIYDAPNICRLLNDPSVVKLFHFGRFDIGILRRWTGALARPVYCTKIASKLARTYTGYHGLGSLVREGLSQDVPKGEQSSDWGTGKFTESQLEYAARDVIYLHRLRYWLDDMLEREGRSELARAAFSYLPDVAELDLREYAVETLFSHT